jgi:uncharacterized phage protein (TIGR02218 family)
MAQTNLDTKNTAIYANLVTFFYDVGGNRYVTANRQLIDDNTGQAFNPEPAMKIDLKKQGGGAEDTEVTILMPPQAPLNNMLLGYPFPPVKVVIEELDLRNTATRRILFVGWIKTVVANKNGKADQCEVTVAGLKSQLRGVLGIPACNTCAWQFGDKSCKIDLNPLKVNTTITAINGSIVTIANASFASPYFFRGYVTCKNVSLMVRQQQTAQNLLLVEVPPANWLNQSCVVTPGCDKTPTDCRVKWNNIQRFGGFGIAIPRHHPIYETQ